VHKAVDTDLRQKIGDELVQKTVEEMASLLEEGQDLDAIAEKYSLEVQHSELVSRQQPLPVLGLTGDFFDKVFPLQIGQTSEVVALDSAHAVFKLLEKEAFDPQKYEAEKETLREEMEYQQQQKFFNTTLKTLRAKWYQPSDSDLQHQNEIMQAVANHYIR
jgi:hypothetical protein